MYMPNPVYKVLCLAKAADPKVRVEFTNQDKTTGTFITERGSLNFGVTNNRVKLKNTTTKVAKQILGIWW